MFSSFCITSEPTGAQGDASHSYVWAQWCWENHTHLGGHGTLFPDPLDGEVNGILLQCNMACWQSSHLGYFGRKIRTKVDSRWFSFLPTGGPMCTSWTALNAWGVHALLREIYGAGVETVKVSHKDLHSEGSKSSSPMGRTVSFNTEHHSARSIFASWCGSK